MLLEQIEQKLKEIDNKVFYGTVNVNAVKADEWNFIVFNRGDFSLNQSKSSVQESYIVTIVRENYIEEDLAEKVIDALEKIRPGLKFSNTKSPYDYLVKPGTQEVVIETLSLEFINTGKRCFNE